MPAENLAWDCKQPHYVCQEPPCQRVRAAERIRLFKVYAELRELASWVDNESDQYQETHDESNSWAGDFTGRIAGVCRDFLAIIND